MLVIESIHQEKDFITCSCLKEGEESKRFSLIIDANSLEIIANSDGESSFYSRQALMKIYTLLKDNPVLPSSAVSYTH